MTWVRIDDLAMTHPKLLRAGPDGVCLWLAGLCYANKHATNGLLPKVALPLLYASDEWSGTRPKRAAERLVSVKLWYDEGDSWRIHGYEDYQEEALKGAVEERRQRDKERKRAKRASEKNHGNGAVSARTGPGHPADNVRGHSEDASAEKSASVPSRAGAAVRARDPGPARPVPTEERISEARTRTLDAERLHGGWLSRWRKLDRGEPSGGPYAMASTCWAPEWATLLAKIQAHAASIGSTPERVATAMLDSLFASTDRFVTKDFNPKLLVSQFAQWAPQERSNDELAVLDRELDLAQQRGDLDAADRIRAQIESLCESARARKASA